MLFVLLLVVSPSSLTRASTISCQHGERCGSTLTTSYDILTIRHGTCGRFKCPCGFKPNLRHAAKRCEKPLCDWRDRDTCCIGDFGMGDRPLCYAPSVPEHFEALLESDPAVHPDWPKFPDDRGILTPITSPMMHEMAMDAYRGCSAAFGCERGDHRQDCSACVKRHCAGLNRTTMRPKAADWYPKLLANATRESFIYQFTCASCYLTDPNGRGDGRQGCAAVDDWLDACTMDTPGWTSSEGKRCSDYATDMMIPGLFRSSSLKREVKKNCCMTWSCTMKGLCPTTTTTTTPLPIIDLSDCPYDDGCHDANLDGHACPCSKFVRQVLGYVAWRSSYEERTVRANCCQAVRNFELVKKQQT